MRRGAPQFSLPIPFEESHSRKLIFAVGGRDALQRRQGHERSQIVRGTREGQFVQIRGYHPNEHIFIKRPAQQLVGSERGCLTDINRIFMTYDAHECISQIICISDVTLA